jgi:hypothetical protein
MKTVEDFTRKQKVLDTAISVVFCCAYPFVWVLCQLSAIVVWWRMRRSK